jgi:hypothetical protein
MIERVKVQRNGDQSDPEQAWWAEVGVSFAIAESSQTFSEPRLYGAGGATEQAAIINLAEQLAQVLSYEQTQTRRLLARLAPKGRLDVVTPTTRRTR